MKSAVAAPIAVFAAVAAGWFASLTPGAVAAPKTCTLAPLPNAFQLVNQGGYLGGANGLGPTFKGGLGRQIRVATATYTDTSTETIVAVSGSTNADGTAKTIELFSFNASTGSMTHRLTLTAPAGHFLAMGDINGDGVPDALLGAPDPQVAYVFLSQGGTLGYGPPIAITPPSTTSDFGRAVAIANLDLSGGAELVVGAPGGGSGKGVAGKVFVYRFNGVSFDAGTPLDTTTLAVKSDEFFGWRVAVADVNNDGWPDLLTTAPRRDVNGVIDDGAVYVFLGPAFSAVSQLTTSVKDDTLGNVMSADANDDGFGDVIATTGLVGFNNGPRRAIVFTGPISSNRITVAPPDYSIAAVNSSWSDGWGTGIGSGDLNGDGISDVLVGAPNGGPGACANIGAAHVYVSNAATPTSPTGYLVQPPAALDTTWNAFGWSVAAVSAAANHPGYLLVGEPGRDISGLADAGNLYVYRVCSAAFPCF